MTRRQSRNGNDVDPSGVLSGVLVVDKPSGITSHDVVSRARRCLKTRRVGHLGTLDPLATGVLPLVVGRATRLASLLAEGDKVYDAAIRLGLVTDTYDVTGTPTAVESATSPQEVTRAALDVHLAQFLGTRGQRPPAYSAKKIQGVRAYTLARQKQVKTLAPVEVTLRSIEVHSMVDGRISCRIACAPGFYVRSLAHDLGESLGCGGCLEALRREKSGDFGLYHAVTLDALEQDPTSIAQCLVPLSGLLPRLPHVVVTERGMQRVRHGNTLGPDDFFVPDPDSAEAVPEIAAGNSVKVLAPDGDLVAISGRVSEQPQGSAIGETDSLAAGLRQVNLLQPRIVLV